MMQFKAFKPQALNKIAGAMGYQGDMSQFQQFIEEDPQRKAQMDRYTNAARMMAHGGVVKMQTGGFVPFGSVQPVQGGTAQGKLSIPADKYAAGFDDPVNPVPIFPGGGSGGIQAGLPNGIARGGPAYIPGIDSPYIPPPSTANPPAFPPASTMPVPNPPTTATTAPVKDVSEYTQQMISSPAVPVGGETVAMGVARDPSQELAAGTGAITGQMPVVNPALASTATSTPTQQTQANVMQAQQAAGAVNTALQATQAAQANPQDPRAQVTAAQQTASSVGNLQAAQGNAILMSNPQQRQIQQGELISGTGVDATKVAQATAQTQAAAASAQPSQQALVQGQLANLANQFTGTNPPAWAAGAIRTANAQMAARGLGASSLAGQAIVQAAMEASLPIAQADANIIAQFETQNLSNRQQSAMLAAEQRAKFLDIEFNQSFQAKVQNAARVADVANQNFTAEQQIALENSRIANSMNLQNLSNTQALVMAEAAGLSQLDTSNLNNRQQTAVQNANSFLQVDMANLSNQQQTEIFKNQQRIQSMFNDQAAENASRQFNASSQNQVDQFFANLAQQTSQFNAAQQNSQAQFNAGQVNTIERFNSEMINQRDQFNAQNQMVIAQSNAQWRREIATADTAAVNRANELNANAILDISKTAYNNLWQYYKDTMEWAWTSADNASDRMNQLAVAKISADSDANIQQLKNSSDSSKALGGFAIDMFKTIWG